MFVAMFLGVVVVILIVFFYSFESFINVAEGGLHVILSGVFTEIFVSVYGAYSSY